MVRKELCGRQSTSTAAFFSVDGRLLFSSRPDNNLPDESFESVIKAAVDNKVHDAVEDEEEVVDGHPADEPDGGIEVEPTLPTGNHVIHVEQLVLLDRKQSFCSNIC